MISLSKKVGIDLGTANSLVYVAGEGVVMSEPTVVAVGLDDDKVVAVGDEAKEMLGRTPGNIMASRPMRDGVIADYRVTEAMLRYFLQKVSGRGGLFKPEVLVSVPAGVTQVERRAVYNATVSAGARTVYMIDEPLAAAIGAGVPIGEPSGNMVMSMGGSSEAAVISLGGVVVSRGVRVAGNRIDEAIASYIRRKHNLVVGEQTAEAIKLKIGSAISLKKDEVMEVKGRDSVAGLPRNVEITSREVTEAIAQPLGKVIEMIKRVLEEVPPELSSDIIDKGIVMTGGTAQLRNLDRLITEQTNVPAYVAEEPMLCVVKGTGVVLENLDLYKRSLSTR